VISFVKSLLTLSLKFDIVFAIDSFKQEVTAVARAKKRNKDVPFALRLPPQVYEHVKKAAERQDDSMNALLVRVIEREYPPEERRAA
jgi:predicted HicB family RNase H-like nuclease